MTDRTQTTVAERNAAEAAKEDARLDAVARVLRDILGPSPIESPLSYDALVVARGVLAAADAVIPPLRIQHAEQQPFVFPEDILS